jgi:hypothetical protein
MAPLLAAQAQTVQTTAPASSPAAELSPTEQTIQDIKKPVSWMTWGGDFRARDESFDNILTLNSKNPLHEQDYLRLRGRIWTSLTPFDDLSFNVRLSDETREWFSPAGYTAFKGHSGFDPREGVFDTLNFQWRNILQQPFTATVGRQDILLGDGWLTGDGTPLDGSWTYYMDAARLTYELKDQHTTIQTIGIIQDAKDNGWMPTINEQDLYNSEQNEKGAILWVANKSLPVANLDGYFIYKHDDKVNPFSPDNLVGFPPQGDNADIYTLGGRLSGLLAEHWKYAVEGAYQFGQKQDNTLNQGGDNPLLAPSAQTTGFRDIDAFGANSKITYLFKDELNNQVNFSYEFLSGDNPNSKNDEMFDNLWGRYPRWSEIGAYSAAAEARFGQEGNLHRLGPGWSFTPIKDMDFGFAYYALFSEYDTATRGANGLFSESDNFRGHFLQAILKYKFSQHVSAHLWTEVQLPGDYYVNQPTWYFIRPEILFTF